MIPASDKCALLLFARSPEVEAAAKPLSGIHSVDRGIYAELQQAAFKLSEASDMPFYWLNEEHQQGNTFGERLQNAMAQLFAMGYEHLIVIGNDCRSLKSSDLKQAERALGQGKMVLGPNKRGGEYLIGMSQIQFQSLAFENLPWQKRHLHAAILQMAKAHDYKVLVLRGYNDFNHWYELEKLVNQGYFKWLQPLFSSSFFTPGSESRQLTEAFVAGGIGLRAPPVAG